MSGRNRALPPREYECRAVLPLSLLDDAPRDRLAHRHGGTETKGLKGGQQVVLLVADVPQGLFSGTRVWGSCHGDDREQDQPRSQCLRSVSFFSAAAKPGMGDS